MVFLKRSRRPVVPQLVKTSYTSLAVPIPPSYLSCEKDHLPAVTYSKIDFATTALPEYKSRYAVVLDNVLSPDECAQLIRFAEMSTGAHSSTSSEAAGVGRASTTAGGEGEASDGWQPALVNAGAGYEMAATDYRNSDRIIWDEREVVRRIWERCLLAPGLKKDLEIIEGEAKMSILGKKAVSLGHRWRMTRLNERMRFLRYGEGQFFKAHCDGTYETPDHLERTFYTLHLYLNDSIQAYPPSHAGPSPPPTLRGGATTFHALDDDEDGVDASHRLDVDPRAGRVLIFQHAGLLHSGARVLAGTKFTLRTDLLYERVVEGEEAAGEEKKVKQV